MGDPLLAGDIDLAVFLIVALKAIVAFVLLLVSVMLMVWFERKIIADMQHRIGPNKAGPWGILQTLADGTKLFFKEDLLPERADRAVFRRAPLLMLLPAYLIFAIVPVGGDFSGGDGTVELFGHRTYLQLADPPVGILFFLAMSALAVYGVMLAGWSSGSKYPLLGGVRASAQVVSYEAALGLSTAAVVLVSGAISTHDMVAVQAGEGFRGIVPNWNLFVAGFVPAVIFLIAGTAEAHRPPFDLTEAESELVGGYNTEYSSVRFALFYLAEFMGTITMSAIVVTLFFGGPAGPILTDTLGWVWPMLWFFLKLVVFLYIFVWLRGTLPRLRYDQLMDFGWKRLIPAALAWLLFLGTIRVANSSDWSTGQVVLAWAVALAVLLAGWGLLLLSMRAAARTRAEAADAPSGDEFGEVLV
ncbi:MAG: NADH-quinone oxidoreductase subunit H [Acidimicrobiia bacterium]|nr:NADH-quinone oxidoreductase subunit H [Acidimicrobiia bacterium]